MDKKKYVVISVESGKVSEIEKAMNEFMMMVMFSNISLWKQRKVGHGIRRLWN